MPEIRPSADMSIDAYEQLCGKFELFKLLEEGLKAEQDNELRPFDAAIADLRRDF